MAKKKSESAAKPGPVAETLKIDMPWGAAVKKAFTKKKPKGGWPKAPTAKKGAK